MVDVHTGESITLRCQAASRVRCQPCSVRYRRRVRRIFASGYVDRPTERAYLVTLTAPGDHAHELRGQRCPCTPEEGVDLAVWNATAGQRWNRFVTYLRRIAPGDVEYARAAEVQARGALHFHAIIRTRCELAGRKSLLRSIAIRWGFGHAIDVQAVTSTSAASYCAKYVSKSADDRADMPWLDRCTGERTTAARYRPWSASRRWGLTMAALREAQRSWAVATAAAEQEQSSNAVPLDGSGQPLHPSSQRSPDASRGSPEPPCFSGRQAGS